MDQGDRHEVNDGGWEMIVACYPVLIRMPVIARCNVSQTLFID